MRHIKLLLIILFVAAFFYLYKLGDNPPGLYADEVSTGYNAYSILKTGKDEYGKVMPFAFRQMGSYTPPLYIYSTVPSVALFGLSEFSTRFPSVIFGLISVVLVFYLLQILNICRSKTSLFFSTLFFAVSPWLLFFSRMGYEQNLAFMLFTLSLTLFVKALKNPKFFALLIPVVSLTTYADFPMRFLMPLLFVVFAIIFRKEINLIKNFKIITLGALVAFVIQLPNFYMITTNSFFSKSEHFYVEAITSQAEKIKYLPPALSVPLSFLREFASQYANYFSPKSLFFLGDPDPQRSIPEMGVLYPWTILFYFAGLYLLFKSKNSFFKKITLTLLLITPVTGALTHQPFHMQRTLALLLPLTFVISFAIDHFVNQFGNRFSITFFTTLLLISLMFLWRGYFILLPQLRANTWAFQYKEVAEFIRANPQKHFVIDQAKNLRPEDIAYFQLAFYLKTDPEILQKTSDPAIVENYYNDVDFTPVRRFSNIETKPIDWGESVWKDLILIGNIAAISDLEVDLHDLTRVLEIKDPNDKVILRAFQTDPVNKN